MINFDDVLPRAKALVLWSGGKDSFLAIDSLVSRGFDVIALSFNGGSLHAEKYLLHGIRRLRNKWGEHVVYAGIYPTIATQQVLGEWWTNTPIATIAEEYSYLTWTQVRCLHCQTAMWSAAIAYAIAKDIPVIACGYKNTDTFCTGVPGYKKLIVDFAFKYDKKVVFPVEDIASDFERDTEMIHCGFHPSVLEPKCMIGTPSGPMSDNLGSEIVSYTYNRLYLLMEEEVEKLSGIFTHLKLCEESFDLYDVDKLNVDY